MNAQSGSIRHQGWARVGRWIEGAGIFGFFALVLVHAARFGAAWETLGWWVIVGALLGVVAADFFSGIVHWAADTWGSEDMPWIGPRFLRPFRIHHVDPLAMLSHDFFETNGNTGLLAIPILLAALALPLDGDLGQSGSAFLAVMGATGFGANQIHKWAHTSDPPPVARWLQRRGLILTPQHHAVHHTAPFATHYCITTGWCNALLAALGFFPALERRISALTGLSPRGYELAQPGEEPAPRAAIQRS